jgi:hypothetical protein
MTTRIAFFYSAEAYQVYHNASVAFELARHEGCQVEIFYADPESPAHIERIRQAFGGVQVPVTRLKRGVMVRAVQSLRYFGFWKEQVMRENARTFEAFDAVVCAENTDSYLRKAGLRHPLLVYMPHGAGDRAVGYIRETADFDFVTPPGQKCAARMLRENLIRPGHYAVPGYIKHEIAQRVARITAPLFANGRPIVLYNAHRAAAFTSWPDFVEPIMRYFAAQDRYNLIVAPHVKMFHRLPDRTRKHWQGRSTATILVDTGSAACLDMTYTNAASIYVGDVSSQVYEFLTEPKPCIFLNPRHAAWRDDPNYAHWNLGEVIGSPEELPAAIDRAYAVHPQYAGLQREQTALTLGDISPGASARAAGAILAHLGGAGR